jgi:hypothetical protein
MEGVNDSKSIFIKCVTEHDCPGVLSCTLSFLVLDENDSSSLDDVLPLLVSTNHDELITCTTCKAKGVQCNTTKMCIEALSKKHSDEK